MRSKSQRISFLAASTLLFGFLTTASSALPASTEKVLYNFCSVSGCEDGSTPMAGLIFDSAGNLYGTTNQGGDYNFGTVFELTPNGNGTWTDTVLYSFCPATGCADGAYPSSTLIFDAAGNLYGTTPAGGSKASDGTVFQLTPGANGHWTETVIHSFKGHGSGGSEPVPSLLFDRAGNLYGATVGGPYGSGCGGFGCGLVFELTPGANGKWTEKVLHSFKNNGKDGVGPASGLVFDALGNLYGTTPGGGTGACNYGGPSGCGTVFELTPSAKGMWTEKVLYSFKHNHKDGVAPIGSLAFDTAGNLYGTTNGGGSGSGCHGQNGAYGCGTVFELTPGAKGKWTERVLHSFTSNGRDGLYPFAGATLGAADKLYGTTNQGGDLNYGTVFELTPNGNGRWSEKIVYSFCSLSGCADGAYPLGTPILDDAGNLYGTTLGSAGGTTFGTVFEITP
jgi:uncharacterized repeat protein (TIGR03803 family)